MLDERTSLLLEKINDLCGEGGFHIAEESELLSAFPTAYRVEKDELMRILRHLERAGYLEIKYAEEGVYCLCPSPEGRGYFETMREKRIENGRRRREIFLISLLGAFCGGLFAALLVSLISMWVGA